MTQAEQRAEYDLLSDVDGPRLGQYRPEPPDRGPGRWLRRIAGVREDILDWVPEERPRYTRLGAIIFNTGLMAAISLLAALGKVLTVFWLFLIPISALWGFVIISFDGWLIASTHGVLSAAKYRVFIPRLVISLLMGVIIAEPLLLWVFQPTIRTEVRDFRQTELIGYESQLTKCNPASGAFVATAFCSGFHLSLANSPDAVQQELNTATAQRDQLSNLVAGISAQYAAKENFAANECAGKTGPGLTGQLGDGPECLRDRKVADQFRVDNQLSQRQAELTALNSKVVRLTADLAGARQAYGQRISTAIVSKVTARRLDQGKIGILDEDAALGRLSSRSAFVFAAQWLLRLLLVAIDCLPVLTKMIGGTTAYDELVARQTNVSKRLHDRHMSVREGRDGAASEVRMQQTEHELRTRIEEIDERDRAARARRESGLENEIDELAARLRQQHDNTAASQNGSGKGAGYLVRDESKGLAS